MKCTRRPSAEYHTKQLRHVAFTFLLLISLICQITITYSYETYQDIYNAKIISRSEKTTALKAIFYQSGYINTESGYIKYLELNLSIPANEDNQKAETTFEPVSSNIKIIKDNFGNLISTFKLENPRLPFTYSAKSTIETKERKITSLPSIYSTYNLPIEYRLPNKKDNFTEKMRLVAQQVTEPAMNDFEKIALIAKYVNELVKYDYSMSGKEMPATWVFENRRGVCVEYTNLFIALIKSLGYPARTVSGYAYDEKNNKWQGHSWAEVYLGTWVPVDPTWMEVGRLDATHIVLYRGEEIEYINTLSAITAGSNNAQITWKNKISNSEGDEMPNIQIQYALEQEAPGFSIIDYPSTISFGSKKAIIAVINSDEFSVENITLISCAASDLKPLLKIIDSQEFGVLYPNNQTYFWWIIEPDQEFYNPTIYYTCPVQIISNYHGKKIINIEVKGLQTQDTNHNVALSHKIAKSNSDTIRLYRTQGQRSNQEIYYVGKHQAGTLEISPEIKPEAYGINKILVYDSEKNPIVLEFQLLKDTQTSSTAIPISISAKNTLVGNPLQICINISNPENKTYFLEIMNNGLQLGAEKHNTDYYCTQIESLSPGKHEIIATISGFSISTEATILEEPLLEIVQKQLKNATSNGIIITFYPEKERNVKITSVFDNTKNKQLELIGKGDQVFVPFEDKSLTSKIITIEYSDEYGNYTKRYVLTLSNKLADETKKQATNAQTNLQTTQSPSAAQNGKLPILEGCITAIIILAIIIVIAHIRSKKGF